MQKMKLIAENNILRYVEYNSWGHRMELKLTD